jgi:hypothetical protein
MITRTLVRPLLVVLVTSGVLIGVAVSPASQVFASCPSGYQSCSLEKSNTKSANIYEGGCNCYITWYWTLNTYKNTTNPVVRHYEMTVSTGSQNLGAGAVLIVAYVRVWACGNYQGEWSASTTYWYRVTEVTPEFDYGFFCGRQADDGGSPNQGPSYVQGPSNWNPQTVSVYLNQG